MAKAARGRVVNCSKLPYLLVIMPVSLEFPGSKWPIDVIRPQTRRESWKHRCRTQTRLCVYGRQQLQTTDIEGLETKSYQRHGANFGWDSFGGEALKSLQITLINFTQCPKHTALLLPSNLHLFCVGLMH